VSRDSFVGQPNRGLRGNRKQRSAVADLLPLAAVVTIPQKELRNNAGDVLRRAEAGEQFTITVSGRPVAELGPTARRSWVSGPPLSAVFLTPAPRGVAEDLAQFPGSLIDPFS
jgi:prevent-host-death family protein